MIVPNISTVILASMGIASAVNAYSPNFANFRAALERRQQVSTQIFHDVHKSLTQKKKKNNNRQGNNGNNGNNPLLLLAANVQAASNTNGQAGGAAAGQSPSATDPANFINFCTGKTLTNGLQVKGGSCNGIGMVIRF